MSPFQKQGNLERFCGLGNPWHDIIARWKSLWTRARKGPAVWFPFAANQRKTGTRSTGLGALLKRSGAATCAAALLAVVSFAGAARAQQPGQTKIPKIGKIRGGDIRQAFTGKVQSVDKKLKVLNVKAEEGTGTEIFPIKKNVDVQTLSGERRELSDLKPGSDVMIFYQLKGSERTIKRIILLTHGSKEAKKKSSPPS